MQSTSLMNRIEKLVYQDVDYVAYYGGEGHYCDLCPNECITHCWARDNFDVCKECYEAGHTTSPPRKCAWRYHCGERADVQCSPDILFSKSLDVHCCRNHVLACDDAERFEPFVDDVSLVCIASGVPQKVIVLDDRGAVSRDYYEPIHVPDSILALDSLPAALDHFYDDSFPGTWASLVVSIPLGKPDGRDLYVWHWFTLGCIRYWLPFVVYTYDSKNAFSDEISWYSEGYLFVGIGETNQGRILTGISDNHGRVAVSEHPDSLADVLQQLAKQHPQKVVESMRINIGVGFYYG